LCHNPKRDPKVTNTQNWGKGERVEKGRVESKGMNNTKYKTPRADSNSFLFFNLRFLILLGLI
jgi:hypothetical protein